MTPITRRGRLTRRINHSIFSYGGTSITVDDSVLLLSESLVVQATTDMKEIEIEGRLSQQIITVKAIDYRRR